MNKNKHGLVYETLIEPAKYTGDTIVSLLKIFFDNINYQCRYLTEKRELKLQSKLKNLKTDIESIHESIAPPLEIISKVSSELPHYVDNNDITDMFYNLLLASFDKSKINLVHPAFIEIIKQLSPVDARMLKAINKLNPLKSVTLIDKKDKTFPFAVIYTELVLEFGTEQCALSTSNLTRLGLINIKDYNFFKDIPKFVEYRDKTLVFDVNNEDSKKICENLDPLGLFDINDYNVVNSDIQLTILGKHFMKVCINN